MPCTLIGAGQADNHNNGSHNKVGRFAVINFAFYQYAQAAGCNNAEQQNAHAAHNRYGNAVNQLGELADEGKQNGKYCRAAGRMANTAAPPITHTL